MTPHPCRAVDVLGTRLTIAAPTDAVRDRIDRLLASFPGADGSSAAHVRVAVGRADGTEAPAAEGDGEHYDLVIDDVHSMQGVPLWRVEDTVLFRLNRWLVANDTAHVHLHAGAVTDRARGVVLAGPSGAGKSTLTAHLVRTGFGYLTDETIAVTPSGDLRAYPRPLTLKPGAWRLFPELPSVADALDAPQGRERVHLPPLELGADPPPAHPLPPALVVVLDPETDGSSARVTAEHLRPEVTVGQIVANSLDLNRAGVDGIRAVVRIACRARGIRIGRGDLDATAELIRNQLDEPHSELGVEELATPHGTGVRRAERVHTWVIGGAGAVVYREEPGEVFELDPQGVLLWRALDGTRSPDELVAAITETTNTPTEVVRHDVIAFVDDLAARGLLAGS